MVVHVKCLRASLTLIVTGTGTECVDVPPVILGLGMDLRIAVDLACGGEHHFRLRPLRQPQGVDRTHHRSLDGFYTVILIVKRRSRTCKVIYLIRFDINWGCNIVPDYFKIMIIKKM